MWVEELIVVVFFKQKTAYEMRISDWSSDVCSSDLRQHNSRGRTALCKRGGKNGWLVAHDLRLAEPQAGDARRQLRDFRAVDRADAHAPDLPARGHRAEQACAGHAGPAQHRPPPPGRQSGVQGTRVELWVGPGGPRT